MEAILFCGIQATGKSSFYKERFFRTHVRISLDQLNTRNKEAKLIEVCLAIRQPFVVDNTNPTKLDRAQYIASVLAGEASAKFSLLLGGMGAFDCRISELPSKELVVDYFRWRSEDAHRNALNAYCYWRLRQNGLTKTAAMAKIERLGMAEKNPCYSNSELISTNCLLGKKGALALIGQRLKNKALTPFQKQNYW